MVSRKFGIPVLALAGLCLFRYLLGSNGVTPHDNIILSIKCFLFFLIVWLLYWGKQQKNRFPQVCAILIFLIFLLLGTDNVYTIISPDNMSNRALGNLISTENAQGKFVSWNPYIFGGMPNEMIGSSWNQAQGMSWIEKAWLRILFFNGVIIFLYFSFRFKSVKTETKLMKFYNSITADEKLALFILIFFVFPLIATGIKAIKILGML